MHGGVSGPTIIYSGLLNSLEKDCLQLRSLSAISDNEAIEVAKLCQSPLENYLLEIGKDIIKAFLNREDRCCIGPQRLMEMYQYLQQQSFALPVFFRGTLYSVDKLVELGIIKIKES